MIRQVFTIIVIVGLAQSAGAKPRRYADQLCEQNGYHCIVAQKGDKWRALWPDDAQRKLVMRINRMNTGLVTGMKIVVPENLEKLSLLDVAPFPKKIDSTGDKQIQIKLSILAWAAYNENGQLIHWGPASGGKDYCPDVQRSCRTITGEFAVLRKGGPKCKSSTYPVDEPGAPMPYCMFFHGGYAIHGSPDVPGHPASHGCVRIWVDDAKWMNREFVDIGTPVVVQK